MKNITVPRTSKTTHNRLPWQTGVGKLGTSVVIAAALSVASWAQRSGGAASPAGDSSLPQVNAAADSIAPDMVLPAAPNNYLIGSNDVLAIFVYQVPELTRQVMVSSKGEIQLAFMPTPITAAGLTAPQVGDRIAAALKAGGLVKDPQVQVVVRQVASRPIVVTGAVAEPQTLQASRPMTLLEVLSHVGGLKDNAGDLAIVSSTTDADAPMQRVSLAPLMRGDPSAVNPVLDGNQMVRVLQAEQVYVVGSFKEPGAFPVTAGKPVSVLAAVALAHGLVNPADKANSEIIHRTADGGSQVQAINVDAILKNKAPDVTLGAGDILYVPESGKRLVVTQIIQDVGQIGVIAIGYSIVK